MRRIILFLLCCFLTVTCVYGDNSGQMKKSPVQAVVGSLILPILGHGYIGGDNVRRGLYYTGTELLCLAASSMATLAPETRDSRNFLIAAGSIHAVSMIDAVISVDHINQNKKDTSYFISICGSAIMPSLGHSYIGTVRDRERGWMYMVGILAAATSGHPDVARGIWAVNILDAAVSTYAVNRNNDLGIIFLPDKGSGRLLFVTRF